MVALFRSPHFDPWTKQLFRQGGEDNLHPKLDSHAQTGGIAGGVIMSKLGNETAKYDKNHPYWKHFSNFH